ncbi:kappa-type opioid receptor-like [Tubulanus polymorphus]|uniref:kappa-type opioid receptor-like n=1 Tax=Tubulanus polymorphus TaxID=672921 RepID=UPI003DA3761E
MSLIVNETDPAMICCGRFCDGSGFYTYGAVMTITRAVLYTIGFVSNCLAFIVLRLMKLKGSSILYLEMLAVADTVSCLTGLFGRELVVLSLEYPFGFIRFNRIFQEYYRYMFLHVDAIFQMTTTTSPWLLFALSLDRYVAIRFPLYAKNICTIRNAFRISAAIWILTFIFDLPTIWDEETFVKKPGQPCEHVVQRNFLLLNKQYAFYYDFLFGRVVLRFIPGLIVLCCNIHMAMLVRAAARLRRKLQQIDVNDEDSTNSKQGQQITLTILALNVIFMVDYGMSLTNTVLPAILPNGVTFRPYHSGQLFNAVNSMMNLFVYLGIRRGFGKTLVWFLSCRRLGKLV